MPSSRAGYYMRQFGLVGEQLMNSPFNTGNDTKTQSVGYNLHINEKKESPLDEKEGDEKEHVNDDESARTK